MSEEARHARGVERTYAGDAIEVRWEPAYCIHTGNCIRALPQVFDAEARPWIRVEAADADAVAAAVELCPTGALGYRRLDGGADEQPTEPTTVTPRPNGPLFVRGRIRVETPEGALVRETTRAALCRCGASSNKPFCDGTHRAIGFTTASPPAEGADEAGEKPAVPAEETGGRPAPEAAAASGGDVGEHERVDGLGLPLDAEARARH